MSSVETRFEALRAQATLVWGVGRAAWKIGALEFEQGALLDTLGCVVKRRGLGFARDWSYAELLEWAAVRHGEKPFLQYGRERYSFAEMNRRANNLARALEKLGVGENVGVAIFMSNHPRFLDIFFAVQKLGGYVVPVNTALRGDGLAYILDHSQSEIVLADHETAAKLLEIQRDLRRVRHVFVQSEEAPPGYVVPPEFRNIDALHAERPDDDLGRPPATGAASLLMYTSGTTGLPKAVVSPYGGQRVKQLGLLSHLMYDATDRLYTCLPLFHANALMLSTMNALWVGIPLALGKRFSASRFWSEVAATGATQLNTVGSMIPILLKTPPSAADRSHQVRRVTSAACPKSAWQPFERRFGVKLWEAYGAVDGAGVVIFNAGNAPVGSLGRPSRAVKWRLVDERGRSVAPGGEGELQVYIGKERESGVAYFRNDSASAEKVVNGWLRTGDLMQSDERGYLYFLGRNTDSMRCRGENVSAYEIESVVDTHPDVLESAAFGVPSPLGEQDIMLTVVPVEGRSIAANELFSYLTARLPKYALPSYIDIADELPKTGTHRVIKAELRRRGVTARTQRTDSLP